MIKQLRFCNTFFLSIIFVAYFLLLIQYVGPVDDVMYQFFIGENGFDYSRPIASFTDAVKSQCNAYSGTFGNTNGRFLIHLSCQLLCGSTYGVIIFSAISAFFFVLLITGIDKICTINTKTTNSRINYILRSTIIIYLILLLTEYPGKTLLGSISFTTNYLWASALNIWALYIFLHYGKLQYHDNKLIIPAIIFCLITGSLQESFSIPISGAFLIYLVFKSNQLTRAQKLCALGYLLGSVFLILAPSNYIRFLHTSNDLRGGEFTQTISGIILHKCKLLNEIFFDTRVGTVSIIFVLLSAIFRKRITTVFSDFPAITLLLIIAIISYTFAIFVVYIGPHQLTIITVVLTAILTHCIMIPISRINKCRKKTILFIMWFLLCISYLPTYAYRHDFKKSYDNIHNIIKSSTNPNVSYDCSGLFNTYAQIPQVLKRYTPAQNGMMHFTCERFFETCSYMDAFKTSKGLTREFSLLPISPDSIGQLNKQKLFNKPIDLIQCENYFILRYNKSLSDVSIEYNVKAGMIQKIATKLGKTYRPIEISIEPTTHTFENDSLRFSFIFLDPTTVSNISPVVHNHDAL